MYQYLEFNVIAGLTKDFHSLYFSSKDCALRVNGVTIPLLLSSE